MSILTIFNGLFQRKYKPEIFLQLNLTDPSILSHKLFSLPNIHLYIGAPMEYYQYPSGFPPVTQLDSPEEKARYVADHIEFAKQQLQSHYPKKVFKYGFWPHGFWRDDPYNATPNGTVNHPSDAVVIDSSSYVGPWHEFGITAKANYMNRFYAKLSLELAARGLPKPAFVDPDCEDNHGNLYFTGDLVKDYTALVTDTRFDTVKVDGINTLKEWFDTRLSVSGTLIPITNSLPAYYNTANPDSSFFYVSLSACIKDYCLQVTHNDFVKKYLGQVVDCHNWISYSANRSNLAFTVREKEAPIDYNGVKFRQDAQVWSTYGYSWVDTPDLNGVYGYHTFNDSISKFSIDTGMSINNQIQQLWLKEIDFNLKACSASNSKPLVLWLAWPDLVYNSSQIPPIGGSLNPSVDVMTQVITIAKNNKVARIGLFEPLLSTNLADKYYAVFTNSIYLDNNLVI